MAKKETKKASVAPEVKAANEMVEVVIEKPKPKKIDWEVKNRLYYLTSKSKPLSYQLKAREVYFFDEEKGYERELKNTSNQKTPFVDEMVGDHRLESVIFRNGALFVPKEKTVLQKFLKYHPHRDNIFYEHDAVQVASDDLDYLELEADALVLARTLEIDKIEAILRVEVGSKVSMMSSKELKRDCLVFARKNPALFLELVQDENIELRNYGIKAVEAGLVNLSADQRTFTWASNSRKLLTVPFDEHPYSALAAWFKTDEGMEVYSNIEKRLNM